jgi:hypothetical protein
MKESAVDCVLFRNANIVKSNKKVKQITSSGETLDLYISDKPYSALCDYKKNCEYDCTWMPNPRKNYPINKDTYNLKFSYNQILNVKKDIKNLFRENNVYSLDKIEYEILKKKKDMDKMFIYSALEELVNNRNEIILNKFNIKGYIIYRGEYYVFQPFDLEREEIPLIYRENPMSTKPESVDLEFIEIDLKKNKEKVDVNVINENDVIIHFFKNYNLLFNSHLEILQYGNQNNYKFSIIGYLFDRLNNNEKIIFIKFILTNYLQKSKEVEELISIVEYLNHNNLLINYYLYIEYDKSKVKENLYIGFVVNKNYFIINNFEEYKSIKKINYKNIQFKVCSKDLIEKIKTYKNMINKKSNKEYNQIYGILVLADDKKNKKFKIIDKSLEQKIITKEKTKSKRSIKSGIVCGSLKKEDMKKLIDKLNIYDIIEKKKKIFVCEDLEIYFRMKNLSDINKIWFENII